MKIGTRYTITVYGTLGTYYPDRTFKTHSLPRANARFERLTREGFEPKFDID